MPGKQRHVTFEGQTFSLSEWARRKKIPLETLHARLNKLGWSVDRALSEPVKVKFSRRQRARPVVVPPMKRHGASGRARVWYRGEYHYLGAWGSEEAAARYRDFADALLAGQEPGVGGGSVAELCLRFLADAETRRSRAEVSEWRTVCQALNEVAGTVDVEAFTPGCLQRVRGWFLDFRGERGRPWTRQRVNAMVQRARRLFSWGVGMGLVPLAVWQALAHVPALGKRETPGHPEQGRQRGVSRERVWATLGTMESGLGAMVKLHWLIGCRASEIVVMRACDLDREADVSGACWLWRPCRFKTQHLETPGAGSEYWLGPEAVGVAKQLLSSENSCSDDWLFPGPSGHARTGRLLGRWTKGTYCAHVRAACLAAGVEVWTPRQVRKGRASEIELQQQAAGRDGLRAAQAVCGHADPQTTRRHYAEGRALALVVAGEMG